LVLVKYVQEVLGILTTSSEGWLLKWGVPFWSARPNYVAY
jgi:hypothetical protein